MSMSKDDLTKFLAENANIPKEEAERQVKMLKLATKIEKTRGMAQGEYIKPNFGDNKEKVAKLIIDYIKEGKKVAFVLNAKKETAYLFSDVLNVDFSSIINNQLLDSEPNKPMIIANLDENIGLPRIRSHAKNIKECLASENIAIDYITGGLDEYPITAEKAEEFLKNKDIDLLLVAGVPHAFKIENLDLESIAMTDGPRLVEPLRNLGYDHVVAELDAHSKTLGTEKIVDSDFGLMLRTAIEWENDSK